MSPSIMAPSLIVLASCAAFGQPAFDAASVKPFKSAGIEGKDRPVVSLTPGRVTMRNINLKAIVAAAYGVKDYQVSGPAWLSSTAYEIVAKTAAPATDDQLRLMLQNLLADRFELVLHRETKDLPVYEMVVSKKSPALHPAKTPGEASMKLVPGGFGFQNYSMPKLAEYLSRLRSVDRPVVDKTGLDGLFDFNLQLSDNTSDNPADAKRGMEQAFLDPSLHIVMTAQLGLKLESRKAPHEILVIDRVERPSGN